jgi:hypothetical protein
MLFAIITIAAWIFIWVIQYVIIQHVPFFSHDSLYGVPSKISEVILIWLLSQDKATGEKRNAMQGTTPGASF